MHCRNWSFKGSKLAVLTLSIRMFEHTRLGMTVVLVRYCRVLSVVTSKTYIIPMHLLSFLCLNGDWAHYVLDPRKIHQHVVWWGTWLWRDLDIWGYLYFHSPSSTHVFHAVKFFVLVASPSAYGCLLNSKRFPNDPSTYSPLSQSAYRWYRNEPTS